MGQAIPRSMRQMTPEWLTEALGSELLRGAVVTDATVTTFPEGVGFIDRFDEARAKLTPEMAHRIDPQIDETSVRLAKFSHEMLADMAQLPKTINHGDLRLDNMFFDGDEVVLFDWQAMMSTSQQIWATFLVLGTVLLADLDFSSEQGLALFDANYSRTVNAGHVFDVHSYKP